MSSKPRFVFDANVLISAALSEKGKPRRALVRASLNGILLASEDTFEEFQTTLRKKRFEKYLRSEKRERFITVS